MKYFFQQLEPGVKGSPYIIRSEPTLDWETLEEGQKVVVTKKRGENKPKTLGPLIGHSLWFEDADEPDLRRENAEMTREIADLRRQLEASTAAELAQHKKPQVPAPPDTHAHEGDCELCGAKKFKRVKHLCFCLGCEASTEAVVTGCNPPLPDHAHGKPCDHCSKMGMWDDQGAYCRHECGILMLRRYAEH